MKNFMNEFLSSECFLPLLKDELLIIRIYKKRRILEVWSKDRIVDTFKIVLGRNPEGRKTIAGDGRTPEGIYYICTKNDKSKYSLFLGLSYPGKEDAKRGLLSGIINELMYYEIIQAIEEGIRPPWDTPLGGEIGIHGGGILTDWTQGCIAMDDADIKKLWDYVKFGTLVEIYK